MRKIVSLVIVLTMVLCMFPMSSMIASAEPTTNQVDLSDETKYPDGGTYTDEVNNITYTVVRSATTFKAIKNAPDGNYILAKDISIPGTYNSPLLGSNTVLSGIINGNGYAIKHFAVTYAGGYGTFGVLAQGIKNNAKIINLSIGTSAQPINYTVNNAANNNTGTGVIAGKILSDSSEITTVEISGVDIYCNISVNVAISAGFSLGGFIGRNDGSNAYNLTVSDCSFTGDISFTENAKTSNMNTRVGSLIGWHGIGGTLSVSDFTNNANINATQRASGSNGSACIGGIVGLVENASASFENCTNMGDITSDRYSGGMIGRVYFANSTAEIGHSFEFEGCVNNGDISAVAGRDENSKTRAGGILGECNFGTYTLNNCGNTGNISAGELYQSNKLRAGGMIGFIYFNNSQSSITNCYSLGTISSSLENDERSYNVYALCVGGMSQSACTMLIQNCKWDMTFNGEKIMNGGGGISPSADSTDYSAANLLAKNTTDTYETRIQKSNDGTMIRVLLLTDTSVLDANTDVVIKVYCGNTGKQFTVDASDIFALESVDAAGEMYYGVGGTYIFGAVITGIPEGVMEQITDITVEYGSYSDDFNMTV